jgi:uncharacterized protein YcbX
MHKIAAFSNFKFTRKTYIWRDGFKANTGVAPANKTAEDFFSNHSELRKYMIS